MIVREYKLWNRTNRKTGKKALFEVSDALSVDDERPPVAEFPISEAHPEDVQHQRAVMYCEYMNRIVKATQEAYEQNMLVDKIKGTIP